LLSTCGVARRVRVFAGAPPSDTPHSLRIDASAEHGSFGRHRSLIDADCMIDAACMITGGIGREGSVGTA
jgi:hypothetical protein